jgi:hypothetical protein
MPYPVNFYTLTLSTSTLIELSNGIYLTASAVNPEVVKKSPRLNATGAGAWSHHHTRCQLYPKQPRRVTL